MLKRKVFGGAVAAFMIAGLCAGAGQAEAPNKISAMKRQFSISSGYLRAKAVMALDEAKAPDSLDIYIAALSDPDYQVRYAGAKALKSTPDQRAIGPLIASLCQYNRPALDGTSAALVSIGKPAVGPLIEALKSAEAEDSADVAETLGKLGDESAVPPLLGLIGDPSAKVRGAVMVALARLHCMEADTSIAASLDDKTSPNRKDAALALGILNPSGALQTLCAIVDSRSISDEVRKAAIRGIGEIDGPDAVKALAEVMRHPDSTGYRATEALGWSKCPAATEVLLEALDLTNPTNGATWAAVQYRGENAPEELLSAADSPKATTRMAVALVLGSMLGSLDDEKALQPLICLMWDSDPIVRSFAVRATWRWIRPAVIPHLAFRLRDKDPDVRRAAAQALGNIKDERAANALAGALNDSVKDVRLEAGWSLAQQGDPEALPFLLAAIKSEYSEIRSEAADKLANYGTPDVVDALIRALKDDNHYVRENAAASLGHTEDKRAIGPLIAALNDDSESVVAAACEALGRLGAKQAVPRIIKVLPNLKDATPTARALCMLPDQKAIPALVKIIEDDKAPYPAQWTAAEALGSMRCQAADRALLALLRGDGAGYWAAKGLRLTKDKKTTKAVADRVAREGPSSDLSEISLLDDPRVDGIFKDYLQTWDLSCVASGSDYYIRRGMDESIPVLVDALSEVSTRSDLMDWSIIYSYLCSGNPTLIEAVHKWSEHEWITPEALDALQDPDDYLPKHHYKWGEQKRPIDR